MFLEFWSSFPHVCDGNAARKKLQELLHRWAGLAAFLVWTIAPQNEQLLELQDSSRLWFPSDQHWCSFQPSPEDFLGDHELLSETSLLSCCCSFQGWGMKEHSTAQTLFKSPKIHFSLDCNKRHPFPEIATHKQISMLSARTLSVSTARTRILQCGTEDLSLMTVTLISTISDVKAICLKSGPHPAVTTGGKFWKTALWLKAETHSTLLFFRI